MEERVAAIVVAGGSGERFGRSGGKQLAVVSGLPLLAHALLALERCPDVESVVLVAAPGRVEEFRETSVTAVGLTKVLEVVPGGPTRQASVTAGLGVLPCGSEVVVVHDGARPLVTSELVSAAIRMLVERPEADGVVVGHPAYDTVKAVDPDSGRVVSTMDRSKLWIAQTPQVFRVGALMAAYTAAEGEGFSGTDDSALVERSGGIVLTLAGPRENLKVTTERDLEVVEALLRAREEA